MEKKQILNILSQIVKQIDRENEISIGTKPYEEGDFWIDHGYLTVFDVKTFECQDIVNITYKMMRDDKIHSATIMIENNDSIYCIEYNDMGLDGYLQRKKGFHRLTEQETQRYWERYNLQCEVRSIIMSHIWTCMFPVDENESYQKIWRDEAEKYILEFNDDQSMQYAYADVAFVNNEGSFSKEKAFEYVKDNIAKYLEHLEQELNGIVSKEELTEIIEEVYQYYKEKINNTGAVS